MKKNNKHIHAGDKETINKWVKWFLENPKKRELTLCSVPECNKKEDKI